MEYSETAYMYETIAQILAGVFVGIMVLTLMITRHKQKMAKYKVMTELLDKQTEVNAETLKLIGLESLSQDELDFRKGIVFLVVGVITTVILFFLGGIGWKLGGLPITIGVIYLFFSWRAKQSG